MIMYNKKKPPITRIEITFNPLLWALSAVLATIAYGFATSAWNAIVTVEREHVRKDSQSLAS